MSAAAWEAEREPPIGRAEVVAVLLLVAGGVAVRCVRFWQTSLLFNDGPTFLALAKDMANGHWAQALAHPYHPLYPFLTLLAHFAIPDWERAAACVSIVSGGIAVLCFWRFARSAFGPTPGWISAIFLAVQPRVVSYSADVQSDGLYLALFLAGVLALWFANVQGRAALAGWAGIFAGLAYLARPEGIGLVVVGGLLAGLRLLRREWSVPGAARWLGALAGAALLVATPYLTWLRIDRGQWFLTQKKEVSRLLDLDDGAPVRSAADTRAGEPALAPAPVALPPMIGAAPSTPRALAAVAAVLRAASNAARPWFLALLLVGVWLRRRSPGRAGELVAAVVGPYALVLLAQSYAYGYVDARHALPPLAVAFGYLGVATPWIGGLVLRPFARGAPWAAPGARAALVSGTLLLVAPALGQALRPENEGSRAEREAVDWLRAQSLPPGALAAGKGRLAYYADRPFVSLYAAPSTGMVDYLRSEGARFVIVEEKKASRFAELAAPEPGALRLVHRAVRPGASAAVYEIVPRAPAAEAPSRAGAR